MYYFSVDLGYITLGQLINVMPFQNNLVKVTISGSSLLEAFEHSVFDFVMNQGGSKLLQVSGKLSRKQINIKHRVSENLKLLQFYLEIFDTHKVPI